MDIICIYYSAIIVFCDHTYIAVQSEMFQLKAKVIIFISVRIVHTVNMNILSHSTYNSNSIESVGSADCLYAWFPRLYKGIDYQ